MRFPWSKKLSAPASTPAVPPCEHGESIFAAVALAEIVADSRGWSMSFSPPHAPEADQEPMPHYVDARVVGERLLAGEDVTEQVAEHRRYEMWRARQMQNEGGWMVRFQEALDRYKKATGRPVL